MANDARPTAAPRRGAGERCGAATSAHAWKDGTTALSPLPGYGALLQKQAGCRQGAGRGAAVLAAPALGPVANRAARAIGAPRLPVGWITRFRHGDGAMGPSRTAQRPHPRHGKVAADVGVTRPLKTPKKEPVHRSRVPVRQSASSRGWGGERGARALVSSRSLRALREEEGTRGTCTSV